MATPVVTVASGGVAVVETAAGMAVTEAANARGMAVTKVVGKPYGIAVKFVDELGGPAVPPVTYATWEAASVAAVTLSGGNLVASNTGTTSTNQGAHVAAASGKTAGKYYFEVKLTTFTGGAGVAVGIGTTAATYVGMSVQATNGVMCYVVGHNGAGTIFTSAGGNTGLTIGARTTGDVIGVAVDLTNRKVWFRLSPSGFWDAIADLGHNPTDPVTGGGFPIVAGTIIPFVTFGSGLAGQAGVAGNVFTANFGASAFVGAVPSGYTAGWPT